MTGLYVCALGVCWGVTGLDTDVLSQAAGPKLLVCVAVLYHGATQLHAYSWWLAAVCTHCKLPFVLHLCIVWARVMCSNVSVSCLGKVIWHRL